MVLLQDPGHTGNVFRASSSDSENRLLFTGFLFHKGPWWTPRFFNCFHQSPPTLILQDVLFQVQSKITPRALADSQGPALSYWWT